MFVIRNLKPEATTEQSAESDSSEDNVAAVGKIKKIT
jgi:hypothetical protein